MTDLPKGDSFNEICPDAQYHGKPHRYCPCGWMEPLPPKLHAYVQMKDLNDSVKYVARLALDRARRENYNPRQGKLTITFDDNGANAVWEPTA